MRLWVVSAFAVGCVLATHGTVVRAGAPAPALDPCGIVTKTEVEQVVGKLKGTPKPLKAGAGSSCVYEFASGKDAFEVWVFPADGIDRGRKQAKKPVAIKGLGEDAFMTRGAFGLDYVDLYIKKGAVTVKLALQYTAGDEDKLRALGQKAVARF